MEGGSLTGTGRGTPRVLPMWPVSGVSTGGRAAPAAPRAAAACMAPSAPTAQPPQATPEQIRSARTHLTDILEGRAVARKTRPAQLQPQQQSAQAELQQQQEEASASSDPQRQGELAEKLRAIGQRAGLPSDQMEQMVAAALKAAAAAGT